MCPRGSLRYVHSHQQWTQSHRTSHFCHQVPAALGFGTILFLQATLLLLGRFKGPMSSWMKGRQRPGWGWPPSPGLQSTLLNMLPGVGIYQWHDTSSGASNWSWPGLHKAPTCLPSAPSLINPWDGRETFHGWAHSTANSGTMWSVTNVLPLGSCLQQELSARQPCSWHLWGWLCHFPHPTQIT